MTKADSSYFFKKYFTWYGEAFIARAPLSAEVVRDTIKAQMRQARKQDDGQRWLTTIYCFTLVQAWEDGCRSDCVGTCSCKHRDFPYPLDVRAEGN